MRSWEVKGETQVLIGHQARRTLECDSLIERMLVSLLVSACVAACSRKMPADRQIEYES